MSETLTPQLPDYNDVVSASRIIEGSAVRTPLLQNETLDELTGGRIFLKAECLQRTGSFKFRGAFNALTHLMESSDSEHIYACSSGNHAQGVALAAKLKGVKATIIMPADAPETKKQRTKRLGAEIVEYDRMAEDREEVTKQLAGDMPIVHPYDNFHVIAGQGTCGLEMAKEAERLGISPDKVLVCAGGGGLMAGILLAIEHHFPKARVHPVEPEGHDDQRRSHESGYRVGGNLSQPSICDAIMTPMPGEKSFAICKGKLGPGLTVSENEVLEAVAFASRELKLVLEPGGAAALAAILAGKTDCWGKTVFATLSGGNIDDGMLKRAVS